MSGTSTGITTIRPDYPTGVFAVFGPIFSEAHTFGELLKRSARNLVQIPQDVWQLVAGSGTEPSVAQGALRILGATSPMGLVCFTDREYPKAIAIANKLGLIDPAFAEAVQISLNKASLYRALQRRGLPVGKFEIAREPNQIAHALAKLGLPPHSTILKPAAGVGSAGVYRPPSNETIEEAASSYKSNLPTHISGGETVVMEYLAGADGKSSEICADGILLAGSLVFHAVHEKVRQHESGVYQDRLMVTPPLEPELGTAHELIGQLCERALLALNCNSCVFHIEFRRSAGEFIPIDVALRPGGGFLTEAIRVSTGIDLKLAHLLIATGNASCVERITGSPRANVMSAAIGAFFLPADAQFNFDRVAEVGRVLGADSHLVAYDVCAELTNSELVASDAGISLCVKGGSPEDAINNIDRLATLAGFRIAN